VAEDFSHEEALRRLRGFLRHARDRSFDHGRPRKGRSRGRRWWRRWRRRLARTLAAADVILAGLGSVFPGVEAIREYQASVGLLIAMRGRDRE